jgi:CRISPR-associated endonuclease Csn1
LLDYWRKWALAGGWFSAIILLTTQNKGKKKMNAETSKAGKTIWAFDLGKGSIGEAVRQGTTFLHKASLLIPAEFAETKTARDRRRMHRTREAHKARERWLQEVMQQAGIEILKGRQVGIVDGTWIQTATGDRRLEQEFPAVGDNTCYTSCLLRIKLMRGEAKTSSFASSA